MGILLFGILVALLLYVFYLIGKGVSKGLELFILILPFSLLIVWVSSILPWVLNFCGFLLFHYIGLKIFKFSFNIKSSFVNFIFYIGVCAFIWYCAPDLLASLLILLGFLIPYRIIKNKRIKKKNKLNNNSNNKECTNIINKKELNINNNDNKIIDVNYIDI